MKFSIKDFFTKWKIKFFIKDFFSKCDQIRRKLRIWSYLLKKALMENFIFCAVYDYLKYILRWFPQMKIAALRLKDQARLW